MKAFISCENVSRAELSCRAVHGMTDKAVLASDNDKYFSVCIELQFITEILGPDIHISEKIIVPMWLSSLYSILCRHQPFRNCSANRYNANFSSSQCLFPFTGLLNNLSIYRHELTPSPPNTGSYYSYLWDQASCYVEFNTSSGGFYWFDLVSIALCQDHCERDTIFKDQSAVQFLANWARVVFVIQVLMPVMVIIAGVVSGYKAMLEYPNRLTLYLAIDIFFYSLYLLPHFLEPITGKTLLCTDKNLTPTSADLKANGLAQFSCIFNRFGIATYRLVFLLVAFAWWQLVLKLHYGETKKRFIINVNGKFEAIWLTIAFAWGCITSGLSTRGEYSTDDFVHACSSFQDYNRYLLFSIDMVCLGLSILVMVDGCRRLILISRRHRQMHMRKEQRSTRHHHGNGHVRSRSRSESSQPVITPSESLNDDGTVTVNNMANGSVSQALYSRTISTSSVSSVPKRGKRHQQAQETMSYLLRRFLIFMVGIFVTGAMVDGFIALALPNIAKDGYREYFFQIEPHTKCMLATCGNDELCEHLKASIYAPRYTTLVIFYTLDLLNALLMCAGVFSPVAWKKRLSNKEKERQQRRSIIKTTSRASRRSTTTSSTSAELSLKEYKDADGKPSSIPEQSPSHTPPRFITDHDQSPVSYEGNATMEGPLLSQSVPTEATSLDLSNFESLDI